MLNICYLCGKESPVWKKLCKTCGNSGEQCNLCRERSLKEIAFICFNCHNGITKGDEFYDQRQPR